MPGGPAAKRLLLFGAFAGLALFLAGLATGAIGAAFVQSEADKAAGKTAEGLLPEPSVHIAPQTIFPNNARDTYVAFLTAEEKEKDEGEGALTADEKKAVNDGAFGGTKRHLWPPVITNTLLSSWVASVLIILLFVLGAKNARLVPSRLQNLCEIAVEALLTFVEGVVGRERGRLLFPIIATIFLFVLFNAWLGLLPIYPSLGFINHDKVEVHLLRPAGTDLNMPLALALVSFVFVELLGLRLLGLQYIGKFVRIGSLRRGLGAMARMRFMDGFQGLLDFFFVGPLEGFSEVVRLVSFTFRLFGNMTAGEILVLMSAFLVPFVATIGVYGLELLVGLVQALIFAGLTLVFAAIAITPHDEEAH